MASSSRTFEYNVFASFHGPDVRTGFLGHFRNQLNHNGITMFNDQEIERSHTIGPALTEAIENSQISIVIFSEKYASSIWCLNELLEILKCKQNMKQIVMTVFYGGVNPSDVRNQTGKFGKFFNKTCNRVADQQKRQEWSQALKDVGNIAGVHFLKWEIEAALMKKIAIDISHKIIAKTSSDSDDMVGLEDHLKELESLLELEKDEVKMVGIWGPAGIGKSTLARRLQTRHSNSFNHHTCFMDNLREGNERGFNDLGLQSRLLSEILNLDISVRHSGAIKERLRKLKVLIILDDVDNKMQLEALVDDTAWFGTGSRIIVITENKELLKGHGIDNTYSMKLPTDDQAVKILFKYAFKQNSPPSDFKDLASRVAQQCGNLPLGLRVVGSSLSRKTKEEWEKEINRLENILDHKDMEKVLRVGYESLHEKEQSLFLNIALFNNNKDSNLVKAILADEKKLANDYDRGLEILVNKSLISISTLGIIVMHKLLQKVGKEEVRREGRQRKHGILTDARDILDVLECAQPNRQVSSILLDTSELDEVVTISKETFTRVPKLRVFKVINGKDGNNVAHITKDIDFPSNLRLLHWEAFQETSFPSTFDMKFLVELNLQESKLQYLWQGSQPFPNLKKLVLSGSLSLKELPDLSNAANLETLDVNECQSLEKIPSWFGNLHKLVDLEMDYCSNLQVVPTHYNLAALKRVHMMGCSKLRNFPFMSSNIKELAIADTMLEEFPMSFELSLWSRIQFITIYGSEDSLEKFPDWIKKLDALFEISITGCSNLASLPEFPNSLAKLHVSDCNSLETVKPFSDDSHIAEIHFLDCYNLSEESWSLIFGQALLVCSPGETLPTEFNHRAIGNSLTIRSDHKSFKVCLVVSPKPMMGYCELSCRIYLNGCRTENKESILNDVHFMETKHLFRFYEDLTEVNNGWLEQDNEIRFEFITSSQDIEVITCGVRILTDESNLEEMSEDEYENLSDGSYEFDEPRVKRLKT